MAKKAKNYEIDEANSILNKIQILTDPKNGTPDFNLLFSNLVILKDFLEKYPASTPIPGDDGSLKTKLERTHRRLQACVSLENNRREKIYEMCKGDEKEPGYEELKSKLDEYDKLRAEYKNLLSHPDAKKFKYPTGSFDYDTLPPLDAALVDYCISVAKILGKSPADLFEGKNFTVADKHIAKIEKAHDQRVFEINKANGVFEQKVIFADRARAVDLEDIKKDFENYNMIKSSLDDEARKAIYTDGGGVAEIDKRIAALKAKRYKKDDVAEKKADAVLIKKLEALKVVPPEITSSQKRELNAIYRKYDVKSLDELNALAKSEKTKAEPLVKKSDIEKSIQKAISKPEVSFAKPIRSLGTIARGKNVGDDIASITQYAQQQYGYTPAVTRDSVIYAKPKYAKGLFGIKTKKVESIEIVEESIAKILEDPGSHYKKALKQANKKCKSLGMDKLDKKEMVAQFAKLIESNDPADVNEAIKRLLSLKCSNSRTELAAISTTHNTSNKVVFLADPNKEKYSYDAPDVTSKYNAKYNYFTFSHNSEKGTNKNYIGDNSNYIKQPSQQTPYVSSSDALQSRTYKVKYSHTKPTRAGKTAHREDESR